MGARRLLDKREIAEPLVEQQGPSPTDVFTGRCFRDARDTAAALIEEEAGQWLVARSVDQRPTLIEDRGAGDA